MKKRELESPEAEAAKCIKTAPRSWKPIRSSGGAQYYVSAKPKDADVEAHHQDADVEAVHKLLDSVELPCWLPHRRVANALGHTDNAIAATEKTCGGPYCWASEFENVHAPFPGALWPFQEPGFKAHGVEFRGSEQFFQVHKHKDAAQWPETTTRKFQKALDDVAMSSEWEAYNWGSQKGLLRDDWEEKKVEVMRAAVGYKFRADEGLRALLISTDPHPLASVKKDCFWGIGYKGEGKNMLAKLLMNLRDELLLEGHGCRTPGAGAAREEAADSSFGIDDFSTNIDPNVTAEELQAARQQANAASDGVPPRAAPRPRAKRDGARG